MTSAATATPPTFDEAALVAAATSTSPSGLDSTTTTTSDFAVYGSPHLQQHHSHFDLQQQATVATTATVLVRSLSPPATSNTFLEAPTQDILMHHEDEHLQGFQS